MRRPGGPRVPRGEAGVAGDREALWAQNKDCLLALGKFRVIDTACAHQRVAVPP